MLAAFDLTKKGVINKKVNKPAVYTYGSLRIGDHSFASVINSTLTVWRVVKQGDYVVRIPSCYYSRVFKSWRCVTSPTIGIYKNIYPLKIYVRNYISPLTKTILLYRKKAQALKKSRRQIKKLKSKLLKSRRGRKTTLGRKWRRVRRGRRTLNIRKKQDKPKEKQDPKKLAKKHKKTKKKLKVLFITQKLKRVKRK